jgi:hypothetical protein
MDQKINYNRLVNGLQLSRDRNPFNEYKNKKIEKAQYYLSSGIYSLKEFLQLFCKENLRKQHKIALLIGKYLQIIIIIVYFVIYYDLIVKIHILLFFMYNFFKNVIHTN